MTTQSLRRYGNMKNFPYEADSAEEVYGNVFQQ